MKTKSLFAAAAAVLSATLVGGEIPLFKTPFVVEGKGGESDRVLSDAVKFTPGETCWFSFSARRDGGGSGTVVSGPDFANVDWSISDPVAATRAFAFHVGDNVRGGKFHLGGWRMVGKIEVESASMRRVREVYGERGGMTLGHGESADGHHYGFASQFGAVSRNSSRALFSHTAGYNSDRWCIGSNLDVVYRHALAGRRFVSGKCTVRCGHFSQGAATVECSADRKTWRTCGAVTNVDTFVFALPADVFPAAEVFVRIAGRGKTYLQIHSYSFDGEFDGAAANFVGSTKFVDAESGELVAQLSAPAYFDEDYGERLAAAPGVVVWSASSARKIPPFRVTPSAVAKELVIRAAANESEAAQLVVSATDAPLANVRVALAGDLVAENGKRIPASAVDVRRVRYVNVEQPTDYCGSRGLWPDPLVPQTAAGCAVAANECQPFRVRVKPPKGTPKGIYRGALVVKSNRGESKIPFAVETFGFEMPDKMTCETAFGFSLGAAFRYHKPQTEAQKDLLEAKYLRLLSANHISPYNPAQRAPWKVTWRGAEPTFDWSAWDKAIERAFGEYNFNTVKIDVEGLGGGTFHSRVAPSLRGVAATNALYETMMAKYLGGIESHLREKGWLDKAYVYWFDEPDPKDYEFVMRGFATLKRHAPGIRRMLTEQPEVALLGGPNLWCPHTVDLHVAGEAACRRAGDGFWWYVCCGPRAPYVTEFIDHPGIEMRLWSWQTWKENVGGLLIWASNYWTSDAAYPDPANPQNPYEDAMSWVSGYSTPAHTKRAWGNGDGRLLYPPESAADGKAKAPVLDDPVPSFRLEMLADGIEDYELFAMLKRRLETASAEDKAKFAPLLKVPDTVTKSMTEFAVDPAALEAHRVKLARALESLAR